MTIDGDHHDRRIEAILTDPKGYFNQRPSSRRGQGPARHGAGAGHIWSPEPQRTRLFSRSPHPLRPPLFSLSAPSARVLQHHPRADQDQDDAAGDLGGCRAGADPWPTSTPTN